MPGSKLVGAAFSVALAVSCVARGADQPDVGEAFAQLAVYDFGRDESPTKTIANLVISSHSDPARRRDLAARLAGVLRSDAPRGAKDFACRQLSLIGAADDVPALVPLLADENLSHMARYALEQIPGPAADDALREALGKVRGRLLVGVINSLGNRRAESAVGDLAQLLASPDPPTAEAAAAALGKIGLPARTTLEQTLGRAGPSLRPAVAQALLVCAEKLLRDGQREEAAAIYDCLLKTDIGSARAAAARGAALARQGGAASAIVAYLEDGDPDLFQTALSLVREAPGGDVARTAAATLDRPGTEKRILLLEALADRGDRGATAAILAQTQASDKNVRVAAIRALSRLGDASTAPIMVDLAASDDPEIAQVAAAGLAKLPGNEVDAAILNLLGHREAKIRRVAIEAIGQRRTSTAAAALLRAAADADETIRLSAIKALGDIAGMSDLPSVVGLLLKTASEKERTALEAALASICGRGTDRDACVAFIASVFPTANVQAKLALLRAIGKLGGAKALDAIRAAIQDPQDAVRDAAMRIMAEWPDPAAFSDLAALAKSSPNKTHKTLALRGYIRLIGQSEQAAKEKLAAYRDAMTLAERDEEKKLVLGALGSVPSVEALAFVVPFLADRATKDEAAAAVMAIAEQIAASHPSQAADAIKRVLAAGCSSKLQERATELLRRAGGK